MRSLAVLLPLALLAACGDDEPVAVGGDPTTTTATDQRYEVSTTVLESPEHGPQLCVGGTLDSLPPQCGGPDVVGWDWEAVDGAETAMGTTWGSYHVVGTYADGTFTLTEPPGPPQAPDDVDEMDFSAPCPEPEGGWAVVDRARTTDAALAAAMEHAAAQPDHAGSWIDQSPNPAMADGFDPGDEDVANDPTLLVLVARFTGDLDAHEAELRERWGGALCVAPAEHAESELRAIQDEVMAEPGFLGSGVDVVANVLGVSVVLDDGSLQADLDDRFGPGRVLVQSALQPVR